MNIPIRPASIRQWIRNHRFSVCLLKGKERNSHCALTLVVVGTSIDIEYLVSLAFDGACERTDLPRVWSWGVCRLVTRMRKSADLFFMVNVDTKRAEGLLACNESFFFLPRFVSGEVDFSTAHRLMLKKNVKSDLNRIRKNRLECEVTKDPALFDEFYRTMYVPHITKTFGAAAALTNAGKFREYSERDCELLFVTQDGERIAGNAIVYEKGRARGWAIGVKNGDDRYKKQGALAALYYFEICHLEKRGYSRVHYGGSRPFLRDGAIQYKKKWGMRFTGRIREGFLLKLLRDSPGARAFLRHNPFVHAIGADLHYQAAIFADANDTDASAFIKAIHKTCYFPGMEGMVVYDFDGIMDRSIVPADLASMVSLATTEHLAG